MSGFKGTKEEWFVDPDFSETTIAILSEGKWGENGKWLSSVYKGHVGVPIMEGKANALLISKAPEMLKMLEKAKSMLGNVGEFEIAKEIEQLIKDATTL